VRLDEDSDEDVESPWRGIAVASASYGAAAIGAAVGARRANGAARVGLGVVAAALTLVAAWIVVFPAAIWAVLKWAERHPWDMHDHGPKIVKPENERSSEGDTVNGFVICHHPFGIGVYIPDRDEYAHVDGPAEEVRGEDDLPPIGAKVSGTVLGYSRDQLKLSLRDQ
jgi:hypothetical protein